MKKKYLMNGLAAMAVGLFAASCSKESALGNGDALKHAEEVLGVTIDPNQNWKMTQEVTTYITVNLGTGQDYTVYVYNKSPFDNDDAVYYIRRTVQDASIMQVDLSVPTSLETLYVSVYDSEGASVSKTVFINEGSVVAIFGTALPESYNRRSSTGTRANAGVDYPATSGHLNANGNEWAALTTGKNPKKFGGWVVPDTLTDGQKLRVKAYFQANPDLDYDDPEWRHFFVQQVYKGGTDPGVNSDEKIVAANGSVATSEKMGELYVGPAKDESFKLNPFGNGDCSVYKGVLNNGEDVNTGKKHNDKIILMVNVDNTETFTYTNSLSSTVHNNKVALVSASTIDTWAKQQSPVPGDDVVDKWNRSFMGFDLALLEGEDTYAKSWPDNEIQYAKFSDGQNSNLQYVWDGKKVLKVSTSNNASRRAKAKRRASINGTGVFQITPGFKPEDGESVYLLDNNNNKLGKVTFYGVTKAAVEDNSQSADGINFTAKLECSYIIYQPLVRNQYYEKGFQLRVYHDQSLSRVYLHDMTDDIDVADFQHYNFNGYSGSITLSHTYKVYTQDNKPIVIYGVGNYVSGETIDDGDNTGTNTGTGGDSGTEQGGSEQGNTEQGGTEQGGNTEQGGTETGEGTQTETEYGIYDSENLLVDGEKVPLLIEHEHMYIGDKITISDNDMKITKDNKVCFNMAKIKELVDSGYLPRINTNLRTWIKVKKSDGYFSDWIVTLCKANRIGDEETHSSSDYKPVTPAIYSYAFEDSWMSDYDLNDVVIKVKQNEKDEKKMDVILCCTGASYNLYAFIGKTGDETSKTTIRLFGGMEVHAALGGTAGMFINTGSGGDKFDSKSPATVTMDIPTGYTLGSLPIWIKSPERNIGVAESGTDPHGVVIPMDWQWPREWTSVKVAYPNFINFAANQNNNTNWYEFPAKSGGVIDTSKIFTGQ